MIDLTKLPIATYVFFSLFVVATFVHLVFCFFEKNLGRKITKPMTTGFLFLTAMVTCVQAIPVYIALFFGLLGDIFLLRKGKVIFFALGMFAFMVNHLINIGVVFYYLNADWPFYIGALVYLVLFTAIGYNFSTKISHQKKLALGGTFYFGLLTLSFIVAIVGAANGYVNYLLAAVFGGLCFIVSDCFLTYSSFIRRFKRYDFFIMSTYLLAQLLVVSGLMFTWMIR